MPEYKVTFVFNAEEVRILKLLASFHGKRGEVRRWQDYARNALSYWMGSMIESNQTNSGEYAPFVGMGSREDRRARLWW